MLVLVHILHLLGRDLFFRVFIHNTVSDPAVCSCTCINHAGTEEGLAFESPGLLTDLRLVLSLDLSALQRLPVNVGEEWMGLHVFNIVGRAQASLLITIQQLYANNTRVKLL